MSHRLVLAVALFVLVGLPAAGRAQCPAPSACQIVLFNGLDFTGTCLLLGAGVHDFPALNVLGNDQAKSILVGPGTVAELYEHFTPYGGLSDPSNPGVHATFTADDPNLNDDVIGGLVSSAAVFCDGDGDGVPDNRDACPNSDLSGLGATIVIDDCDSGVSNTTSPSGCTISELVTKCTAGASNHGEFVSCVAHVTNNLRSAGIITGQQKGAIQSCAGQADIP